VSEHSRYTDGKVLRAKDLRLQLLDLTMLLRGLEGAGGYTLDDLRRMDSVRNKVNDTLEAEASAFYAEYTDAVNGVETRIAEEGIINAMAVMMLTRRTLRRRHRTCT
jgi:hypothetical protein